MMARADELENVEVVHMVSMGGAPYCEEEYLKSFRHNALFAGPTTRGAVQKGWADYAKYMSQLVFKAGQLMTFSTGC